MTPEEAIEILTKLHSVYHDPKAPVRAQAIQLGIESIKRLQFMRSYNINQAIMPLPGETKGE
ncbi:hypothetical protein ES703_91012 [subsurface metagenome]